MEDDDRAKNIVFMLFHSQADGQVYDHNVCHCVYPASRTFLNSFYTLGKKMEVVGAGVKQYNAFFANFDSKRSFL